MLFLPQPPVETKTSTTVLLDGPYQWRIPLKLKSLFALLLAISLFFGSGLFLPDDAAIAQANPPRMTLPPLIRLLQIWRVVTGLVSWKFKDVTSKQRYESR